MNFVKTFLAGLLAVVVGTFLVFFLWIFILLGIAGSMDKSVAVHPESILKIDFSEVLTDAPSSDPLAGIDLMTLQTTRQLSLFKALRAIEAAGADDRIKGIYLRMNGEGGVTGSALLEELREALLLQQRRSRDTAFAVHAQVDALDAVISPGGLDRKSVV